MNERAHFNLQDEKFPVDEISVRNGLLCFIVGDVVSLDVHVHLLLLQIQQQVKLLGILLPAQGTFQYGLSKQTKGKERSRIAVYIVAGVFYIMNVCFWPVSKHKLLVYINNSPSYVVLSNVMAACVMSCHHCYVNEALH